MSEEVLPTTIAQVEDLIISLYRPNSPDVIARTQSVLSRLQSSPQAWLMARELLSRPDEKVKFYGILTIIIKLNTESSSLSHDDASELLTNLIGWYLESIARGDGSLIVRKLSSALATFFLQFPLLWRPFVRHLVLCCISGQASGPDGIDTSIEAQTLLARLGPAYTQVVLLVLTNVMEDIAKFDLNSANYLGLYDAVLSNFADAVALMDRGMSPELMPYKAREDAIKCLQSWVWFAQRTSSRDVNMIQSLRHLVTSVINSLTVEDLYDVSAELMIDLLTNCSIFLAESHIDKLSDLFGSLWFRRRYQKLLQGDFDFDSVRVGQLLLAFGEARVDKLMQAVDERSQKILSDLCGLLAAQGYPVAEDKIFVPALEFWSNFAETMAENMYPEDGLAQPWLSSALSRVLQAVSNSWHRIAYPPSDEFASWDSNERVGFHDARKDVIDFLQSVYTLAGPQLVLTFADLMLEALSNSSWSELEAAAFCLGGLADCIAEDARCDDALATVFSSPLFSVLYPGPAAIPPRVRQTCVSLIEHYTEYFERNISQLPPALNLLFGVVGEHPMSAAAGKSILRLCSSCREHLYPEVGAFLAEYKVLVTRQRLDCVASERILGGIGSVVQAIPDSTQRHSVCATILDFIEEDVRQALELSRSPVPETTQCVDLGCIYATADENSALHTALKALRSLASLGRGLQAPNDIPLDLDGEQRSGRHEDSLFSQLQDRIIGSIVQLQSIFNTSGEVTELVCSILRSGFSEVAPGPFVLPPQSVAQYMTRHDVGTPRIGLLVSTACSFLSSLEHENLHGRHEILTNVLLWVVGLLKQLPGPETDPELSQNGIEFVSRLVSKCPAILLKVEPQHAAEFFFLFSLRVLDGKEPLPKASAAEFWANFISIRGDTADLEATMSQDMAMLGPLLAQSLTRNLGGNASRSELDKLSEPLKRLVHRYPMAKTWLDDALKDSSFPSSRVTPEEKSLFLKKLLSLRGSRPTNQVVREFWLSARGSNYAYAS